MTRPNLPAPMPRLAIALALTLTGVGCVTSSLRTTAGGQQDVPADLVPKASFDHACPEQQIALIRGSGMDGRSYALSTWDLEVCGKARRYECSRLYGTGIACIDRSQATGVGGSPQVPVPASEQPSARTTTPASPRACASQFDCDGRDVCFDGRCRH